MNYTKEMVFDYISGAEMDEKLLENLENNVKFMTEVIRRSKDIKLYKYCSNEVKKNKDFVIFLIDEFNDNIDFITKAANLCLDDEEYDEFSKLEIIFKLANLFDKTKKSLLTEYKMAAQAEMLYKKLQIEFFLQQEENADLKEELGLGFAIADLDYSGSKPILDYVAKYFLNEYIFNEYSTLEELIHSKFSSKQELDEKANLEFLLSYIGKFDSALKNYLSINKEILEPLKKELTKIKKNWDLYEYQLNSCKVADVEDEFEEYIEEHKLDCDVRSVILKIIKKFNLQEIFDKHSYYFNSKDEETIIVEENGEFYDVPKSTDTINESYTIEDLQFIKHMTRFIQDTFNKYHFSKVQEDIEDIHTKEEKQKVIKYDFNTRKILTDE